MNILSRVTLNTLECNRIWTEVTVIGIILSAAMIFAVTTFESSLRNYLYCSTIRKRNGCNAAGSKDQNALFFESMPIHLQEGRLPANKSELILPLHLTENGGV